MIKKMSNGRLAILLVFAFVLGFFFSGQTLRGGQAFPDETYDRYEKLKIFTDVMSYVERNYVEPVDTDEMLYGAIKGMLDSLDPHSSFMPPDVYNELMVETKGSFEGLGIEITIKDDVLTVVSPIDDTPAFREGIKAGDRILLIEGKTTKDMTLMDAIKVLRGPKGTQVNISVGREGEDKLLDFNITRDVIPIESVKHDRFVDNISYVRIRHFQENTTEDLEAALREFEASPGGIRGLILDLRNNPGGLLPQSINVADKFIPAGLIVSTKGRLDEEKYMAHMEGTRTDFPIIVLVNGGSASASEIVAGALQDHKRALILGSETFGKGSVQSIHGPLEDGSGLRLTTALYYTPNGTSIQAKGIVPDILVEETEWEYKPTSMKSFKESDLTGHLENNQKKNDKDNKEADSIKEDKEDDKTDRPDTDSDEMENTEEQPPEENKYDLPPEKAKDVQLIRAIELLQGLRVFQGFPGNGSGKSE